MNTLNTTPHNSTELWPLLYKQKNYETYNRGEGFNPDEYLAWWKSLNEIIWSSMFTLIAYRYED